MHFGLLRQRLDILYETVVGSNHAGVYDPKKVWVEWKESVPCAVSVRRGNEHYNETANQRISKDIWFFTVRQQSVTGISSEMRVRHKGMIFDIRHVRPDAQRGWEVTLECEVNDAAVGVPLLVPSIQEVIPDGVVSSVYAGFTVSAEGGVAPYAFVEDSAGLPPGLAINASTGIVSGTPLTAGTWPCEVIVTDAAGTSMPLSFTIVIDPEPAP